MSLYIDPLRPYFFIIHINSFCHNFQGRKIGFGRNFGWSSFVLRRSKAQDVRGYPILYSSLSLGGDFAWLNDREIERLIVSESWVAKRFSQVVLCEVSFLNLMSIILIEIVSSSNLIYGFSWVSWGILLVWD